MKRFALRMSALAAVVLLGWIAMAYAQRETGSPELTTQASEPSPMTLDPPRSQLTDAATATPAGSNPLREASDQAEPETTSSASTDPPPQLSWPTDLPANDAAMSRPETADNAVAVASNESAPLDAMPDPFGIQPTPASASETHGESQAAPGEPPAPNRFASESNSSPLADSRDEPLALPRERESSGTSSGSYGYGGGNPAAPAVSNEGTGQPASDRKLDGPQSPQLSVQKFGPAEIQVGKPATFRVEVKNTGSVTAQSVEIRDQIPKGTRLMDTKPAASRGVQGELVWTLGKIEPGGGASVEMQLMPTDEGEIGSVATVHFSTSASMRAHATKPELLLDVSGPQTVMIDGTLALSIVISNSGSGVATGVVLEEHVPPCLQHAAGAELEYEVGDLAPGESKTLELQLAAVRPGAADNLLIARAEAVAEVKKHLPVEVVAPELKLALSGPRSRYLERQAVYELAVSNPGTAPARDVRLEAELPRGLKFVSANNNAHYDSQTNVVQWALAELPVGETGTVQLTTLPVEMGQHALQLRGTADKALAVKADEPIAVDGIAAINFEVVDAEDPIEVGGETTYEVRVLNQGSKESTRVCLAAALPPGLALLGAEGPDNLASRMQGNQLIFEPLPRLSPKVDVTYRIRVGGRQSGDQRIRVQLTADELQSPVTKEESTRVFSDK